jgi:membrane protease YdiL (CAAX protease family)
MVGSQAFSRNAWPFSRWLAVSALALVAFELVGFVAYLVGLTFLRPDIHSLVAAFAFVKHEYKNPALLPTIYNPGILSAGDLARSIAAVALILGLRQWLGKTSPASFGLHPPSAGQAILGIAAGIALAIAAVATSFIDRLAFGTEKHFTSWPLAVYLHHDVASFALILTQGVVISPPVEELLYRGLIFAGLVQRLGLVWAALLSSALFSAMHWDIHAFFARLVVGLGLAFIYYRTQVLWSSIVAHATINFISFSLLYLYLVHARH